MLTRYLVFFSFLTLILTDADDNAYISELGEYLDIDIVNIDYNDTQTCYTALYSSDQNNDRKVSKEEFVSLAQSFGVPGLESKVISFSQLPRPVRQAFNLLACSCTLLKNSECCTGDNAHLSTLGTRPGDTLDSIVQAYLHSVCVTIQRAIEEIVEITTSSQVRITESPSYSPNDLDSNAPSPSLHTIKPTLFIPVYMMPTTLKVESRQSTFPSSYVPINIWPAPMTPDFLGRGTIEPTVFRHPLMSPTEFRTTTSANATIAPTFYPPNTLVPQPVWSVSTDKQPAAASPIIVPPLTVTTSTFQPATSFATKPQMGSLTPTEARSGSILPTASRSTSMKPTLLSPTISTASIRPSNLAPVIALTTIPTELRPSTKSPIITNTFQQSTKVPASFQPSTLIQITSRPNTLRPSMFQPVISTSIRPAGIISPTFSPEIVKQSKYPTKFQVDTISPLEIIYPITPPPTKYRPTALTPSISSPETTISTKVPTISSPTLGVTSTAPTYLGINVVMYFIGIRNGESYGVSIDLVKGIDALASEIGAEMKVKARFHSSIIAQELIDCPSFVVPEDRCQEVIHVIDFVTIDPGASIDTEDFTRQIKSSIAEGHLQDILTERINTNSNVYILESLINPRSDLTGLGSSSIIGIAFGVLMSFLLTLGCVIIIRRKHHAEEDIISELCQTNSPSLQSEIGELPSCAPLSANAVVSNKIFALASIKRNNNNFNKTKEDSNQISSNSSYAGSSGWSSSFGNSMSGGSDVQKLKKIASKPKSDPVAKKEAKDKNMTSIVANTLELQLLDSQSNDKDTSRTRISQSGIVSNNQNHKKMGSVSKVDDSFTSFENAKISEVYKLMALGDYERIVAVAATLLASQAAKSTPPRISNPGGIRVDEKDTFSRINPDTFGNEKSNKPQKYKGSEKKLVTTSLIMQQNFYKQQHGLRQEQRSLASSSLKENSVRLTDIEELGLEAPPTYTRAIDVLRPTHIGSFVGDDASSASDSSSEASESTFARSDPIPSMLLPSKERTSLGSPHSSSDRDDANIRRQRTALEIAVESGDWEAVGDAAAMLSDTSIQSEPSVLAIDHSSRFLNPSPRISLENASQLDDMISRGDWTSVVKAASSLIINDKISTAKDEQ